VFWTRRRSSCDNPLRRTVYGSACAEVDLGVYEGRLFCRAPAPPFYGNASGSILVRIPSFCCGDSLRLCSLCVDNMGFLWGGWLVGGGCTREWSMFL